MNYNVIVKNVNDPQIMLNSQVEMFHAIPLTRLSCHSHMILTNGLQILIENFHFK